MQVQDSPRLRLMQYCITNGITLAGISGENPQDKSFALQFTDSTTDAQKQFVETAAFTTPAVFGGWAQLSLPDLDGFQNETLQDATLPISTRLMVPAFASLLLANMQSSQLDILKTLWAQAILESKKSGWLFGNTSDGKAITDVIQQHATNNNLLLI